MPFEKELEVALQAVETACYLTHHVSKSTQISGLTKEDKSPVTIADFGAQAVIISAIHAAFPEDRVVGEEDSSDVRANPELADQILELTREFAKDDKRFQGDKTESINRMCEAIDLGNFEGGKTGRQWALDPVDGTKGFLRGGQYAVCLALIVDSKVQLGVIGCPNLGEEGGIFYAIKGQGGSWFPLYPKIPKQAHKKLQMRSIGDASEARFCESVESGHSALGRQSQVAKQLGITNPAVRMDSQAKYCELAKGEADIYLRLPVSLSYEEKIWDHAAGSLLVCEAGGIVTDMYGQRLDFGQGRTLKMNKGIVASTANLQNRILTILAEAGN